MSKSRAVKVKTTEDIIQLMSEAVKTTLNTAANTNVSYSPTFIKTTKTCLRPDIGCFVLFEGGFTGLVAINFKADAALEIYRKYYLSMGMPEEELASHHTSLEVADTMGELMNQSIGRFQVMVKKQIGVGVNQNQPKMIALNQAMRIALETEVDKPQHRRVEFRTGENNCFYMESTTEKVEFINNSFESMNSHEEVDPEDILYKEKASRKAKDKTSSGIDEDLAKELGL